MFSERSYICVCHGCGTFHVVRSSFLSCPLSIGFKGSREGVTWCVPALGCNDCKAEKAEGHTGRIAMAFDKGMAPASYARAVSQFDSEWETKLIAQQNGR